MAARCALAMAARLPSASLRLASVRTTGSGAARIAQVFERKVSASAPGAVVVEEDVARYKRAYRSRIRARIHR
jgi:hypothetical protein